MKVLLNDIEVAYTEAGVGRTCVLIHGLAEDRRSWANVQKSIGSYRTLAYDIRGHGETSLGDADGTLAQLGGDLIAFLETVTGPASCVGYSLGGTIVLWAAAHRPDLVSHAVVAGTSSIVGRAAADFFAQRIELIGNDFPEFAAALKADTALQIALRHTELDSVAARRLEAVGDGHGYINAAHAMAGIRETPLMPLLDRITMPVDIIGGDKDTFCPRKAADILRESLPDAAYHEIPDAGHLMSIDQPALYASSIEMALSRQRGANNG